MKKYPEWAIKKIETLIKQQTTPPNPRAHIVLQRRWRAAYMHNPRAITRHDRDWYIARGYELSTYQDFLDYTQPPTLTKLW